MNAWNSYTGTGVNIAVIDGYFYRDHVDLINHYRSDLGRDFIENNNSPFDPTGPLDAPVDDHATACVSLAAAQGHNGIGMCGTAFNAGVTGLRIIAEDGEWSSVDFHNAMDHLHNDIHIKSCSFGPSDGIANTFAPIDVYEQEGIINAIQNGRNGLGTIFVWATGNGSGPDQDWQPQSVDDDGYANQRYVISVGASDASGARSWYSEKGACLFVNAPSSGHAWPTEINETTVAQPQWQLGIDGKYYIIGPTYNSNFGGPSGAAPVVAGVAALMLQANPNLGWRDVMHILALTSTQISPTHNEWIINAAGFHHSRSFGFGRVNAANAVTAAASWVNVPDAGTYPFNGESGLYIQIPDNNPTGITRALPITAPDNFRVEHAEVTVNMYTDFDLTDLDITLISPSGTSATIRTHNNVNDRIWVLNWTYRCIGLWGEPGNGTWLLKIVDAVAGSHSTYQRGELKLYGYMIPKLINPMYSSGQFSFTATDTPGSGSGIVETSDDLISWQYFSTVNFTSLHYVTVADTGVGAVAKRFYRVKAANEYLKSSNAIGFTKVTIPNGYTMIANPLNHPSGNTINYVIPNPPSGTTFTKYDPSTGQNIVNTFANGAWQTPGMTVNPGEGGTLLSSGIGQLVLVGGVPSGSLSIQIAAPDAIVSPQVPQGGRPDTALGFPVADGNIIYTMAADGSGAYIAYTYRSALQDWTPTTPNIQAGQSFWSHKTSPAAWTRQYNIW